MLEDRTYKVIHIATYKEGSGAIEGDTVEFYRTSRYGEDLPIRWIVRIKLPYLSSGWNVKAFDNYDDANKYFYDKIVEYRDIKVSPC